MSDEIHTLSEVAQLWTLAEKTVYTMAGASVQDGAGSGAWIDAKICRGPPGRGGLAVTSPPTSQERRAFYNAAASGLRSLDARERTARRFGADAEARWTQFAGVKGTLIRDRRSEQ